MSFRGKKVRLKDRKERGDRGLARGGKGGIGVVGRPLSCIQGGCWPSGWGLGLLHPLGLLPPGTGPSPLQGQRASCPPSPFRQVPKSAAPAQAASQGLAPHLLSHSPCQTTAFWVPLAELFRPHPIPPLAIMGKTSQLPFFFYKWGNRLREGQSITLGHTAK